MPRGPLSGRYLRLYSDEGTLFYLDGVANVLATWSTRKLFRAYSGACLRLVRNADDAERDIQFAGRWLNVSDATTWLAGSAGYVKTWYDQSGNGNDIAQAVKADMPLLVAAAVNGHPALLFDGVTEYMSRSPLEIDVAKTACVVLMVNDDNTEQRFLTNVKNTGGGRNRGLLRAYTNTNTIAYTERIAADVTILQNNFDWSRWHVVVSTAEENDEMLLYKNDEVRARFDIAAFGSIAPDILVLGSSRTVSGQWLDGDVLEVVLLDAVMPSETLSAYRLSAADEALGIDWQPEPSTTGSVVLYQAGPVNNRSYRKNAIVSKQVGGVTYQATTFWNQDGQLVLQIREDGGAWASYYYVDEIAANDDHRVVTLGFDADDCLHMAFNMHDNAANIARSDEPIDTFDGLFTKLPLVTYASSVTYVQFWNDPSGSLYCTFRIGGAANGDIYFLKFNEGTDQWAAATGTGANGLLLDNAGVDDTAYFYGVAFDSDFGSGGLAHLSWCWRLGGAANNYNPGYVRWDGTNWTKTTGAAQVVPITSLNQETAEVVAGGTGLSGGGHVASDDNGDPHIVYVRNDGGGFAQVVHTWHNGVAWASATITTQNVVSSTGDPENSEWRAPCIAINQVDGHAYVLYTLLTKTGIIMLDSLAYAVWNETQIYATAVGEWSATHDPWQFTNNDELHLAVAPYPPGASESITVVEYDLSP